MVISAAIIHRGKILVVRKRRQVEFILPGGKPDTDEDGDDIATLNRELKEELPDGRFRISSVQLGTFQGRSPSGNNILVTVYAGHIIGEKKFLKPDREVAQVAWICPLNHDRLLSEATEACIHELIRLNLV